METSQISELLRPFLPQALETPSESRDVLATAQLQSISMYIDLLLHWNSRINLTAVREPREIVTRHFGESFFAARHIFLERPKAGLHVIDVGSGAGFPGLPIKMWAAHVQLTLLESNHKKATFLREVVRAMKLNDVHVFTVRAEDFSGKGDVVTLRAVGRFDSALAIAARLVAPPGRLAILIGEGQVSRARNLVPQFQWEKPIPIPVSASRVLMFGESG